MILRRHGAHALCALVVAAVAPWANAAQIPTTPSGSWTGGSGVSQTATKDMPGGLQVQVETPPSVLITPRDNTMLQTRDTTNTPPLPTDTNGVQVQVNLAGCQGGFGSATYCTTGTLGTLTVRFTDGGAKPVAVRDPVLHISQLGAGIGATPVTVALQLTTAGLTAAAAPGAVNLDVVGGTQIEANLSTVGTTGVCPNAGCGSIAITGTASELNFALGARRAGIDDGWGGGADSFFITVSADEDLGDAPGTFDEGNPASHIRSDLRLGSDVTADDTATINGGATGDQRRTINPGASADASTDTDDAAIVFPFLRADMAGTVYRFSVPHSGGSRGSTVCGWIDFNRNGDFTRVERVCASVLSGSGSATLAFTVPANVRAGAAVARFRAGYTAAQVQSPIGLADSGEVEDHTLAIAALDVPRPPVQLTATLSVVRVVDADGSGQTSPGDTLEFSAAVTNAGSVDARNVAFVLRGDRNARPIDGTATASEGAVTQPGERVVVRIGELLPGAATRITFRSLIRRPLPVGITSIANQGVVTAAGASTVVTDDPDTAPPGDATVVRVAGRTRLAIAASPSLVARVGRVAVYRIRITNVGPNLATGVKIVDRLPVGSRFTKVPRGSQLRGRAMTFTIPTIAPGASVVVVTRVRTNRPGLGRRVFTVTASNVKTTRAEQRLLARLVRTTR